MGFIVVLLSIYQVIILIRVLSSWFPVDRNNKFIEILYMLTEPVLAPARTIMQKLVNSLVKDENNVIHRLDFSPIIVFLILSFLINLFSGAR